MTHKLLARVGRRVVELEAEGGSRLVDALAAAPGAADSIAAFDRPCGGRGLCGKCRVRLVSGSLSPPGSDESALLSAAELGAGIRLACLALLEGAAEVELPDHGEASILVSGPDRAIEPDPPARLVVASPLPRSLEGAQDDESRLLAALAAELERAGVPELAPRSVALGALPALARACGGSGPLAAVVAAGEVLAVGPPRPGSRALGLGLDLGTTAVVAYLVDLSSGESLGAASELNAQGAFGADVISRIAAASSPGGLEELRSRITSQIASMARGLARGAGAEPEDLACIAIAGNATMLHILAGVPPDAIARAPFAPAFLGRRTESARALGLVSHPGCAAILLPGVSAYVGADIVAGMAAIGLQDAAGRSLYLDLGTNGEIAFGGALGILCCATAAGPAFEGAGIERGMGGAAGAIDSAWLEDGTIRYGTIGGAPATGICGSGLVDALAALLDCGLVDETGRMAGGLVEDGPRGPRVYLDREQGVYLSQADVRAAQLAKAAIAAGIDTLLRVAGAGYRDVSRLYLAGGFGSRLDVRGAARIGLIPRELAARAVAVGNASGSGASAACLSRRFLEDCDRAREACAYVELSSLPEFSEAYIERMAFPERE